MAAPGSAIVIGGGPAGAMLAYLLVHGGVPTTLVERHADFAREFRGEGMSPAGMAAIRAVGLWDEFAALPAAVRKNISGNLESPVTIFWNIEKK